MSDKAAAPGFSARELSGFMELLSLFNSSLNIDVVIKNILEKTADFLRAEACSLLLLDPSDDPAAVQIDARRLKQVEDENRRLKHLVADLTLDNQALKAITAKKW